LASESDNSCLAGRVLPRGEIYEDDVVSENRHCNQLSISPPTVIAGVDRLDPAIHQVKNSSCEVKDTRAELGQARV